MAYNLIFSRNRSNDDAIVFGDVAIPGTSIMVDAFSILSQFRRSAGWLYPVREAGNGTYERGAGHLILFGKSRVVMLDFEPPYYLEFFPRHNVGTYILSFYTGDPSPVRPNHIVFPGTTTEVYRSAATGAIYVAADAVSPFLPINGTAGSIAARAGGDGRLFLDMGYPSYLYSWGPPWELLAMNQDNWNDVGALPATLTIPSNAQ